MYQFKFWSILHDNEQLVSYTSVPEKLIGFKLKVG